MPFDDVAPIERRWRIRRSGLPRWRRACKALLCNTVPPRLLRTAAAARMDLLPHQLEPALAILRGAGCRVLIADDVGLGKTVQAGLVAAELLARRLADRVLVLAPAGVRDQWVDELSDRFSVAAFAADGASLRLRTATLPVGLNPWTAEPIAVVSIDYAKRPEVLPAISECLWDLVIVDEAHAAAGESDRHAAVQAIASRASYVLLLTATPHSGDEAAFDRLCGIGAAAEEERLVVFRRTREMVRREAVRRVRTLRVAPSWPERRMHTALARYKTAVAQEHGQRALALAVLDKRAFSSPWSLAQSVRRRLDLVESAPGEPAAEQLTLPLDDPDGEFSADDAPPSWPIDLSLADAARERALLDELLAAARDAAATAESKVRVLRRFLRRCRESIVIFTEYRDTALHLRTCLPRSPMVLHGAMTR